MYNSDHTAPECIGQIFFFSSLLNQLMSSLDSFIQLCVWNIPQGTSEPSGKKTCLKQCPLASPTPGLKTVTWMSSSSMSKSMLFLTSSVCSVLIFETTVTSFCATAASPDSVVLTSLVPTLRSPTKIFKKRCRINLVLTRLKLLETSNL